MERFNRNNKLIINLVGLPASGKSTVISQITEYFKYGRGLKVLSRDIMTDDNGNYSKISTEEAMKLSLNIPLYVDDYDCDILVLESNLYNSVIFNPDDTELPFKAKMTDLEMKNLKSVGNVISIGLSPDSLDGMRSRIKRRNRTLEGFDDVQYEQLYNNYFNKAAKHCDYIISNDTELNVMRKVVDVIERVTEKPNWTFVLGDVGIGKTTYINDITKRKSFNMNVKITDMGYLNHMDVLSQLIHSRCDITFDRCPFIEDLVYNKMDINNRETKDQNRVSKLQIKEFIKEASEYVNIDFVVITKLSNKESSIKYTDTLKYLDLDYSIYVRR